LPTAGRPCAPVSGPLGRRCHVTATSSTPNATWAVWPSSSNVAPPHAGNSKTRCNAARNAALEGRDPNQAARWQREAQLRKKLQETFHRVQMAVREILAETVRASSLVENLNSRLRNYFFLRRHIGDDYLELLRCFLNHRPFLRSDRPERVGKSPAELLNGEPHAHWLAVLGYQRFSRN